MKSNYLRKKSGPNDAKRRIQRQQRALDARIRRELLRLGVVNSSLTPST